MQSVLIFLALAPAAAFVAPVALRTTTPLNAELSTMTGTSIECGDVV